MKTRLSEAQVRRFHRLLSTRMLDFNCGTLCAPANEGIPLCCDQRQVVPVLFRAEWKWLRQRSDIWKRMPIRTRMDRQLAAKLTDYALMGVCKSVKTCKRGHRSLVCRAFPFEPYVNSKGKVHGLVFQSPDPQKCPLVKYPRKAFNDRYVRDAITFWQELVDAIPEEKALYMYESRKHKRRAARKGRKLRIFKSPSSERR